MTARLGRKQKDGSACYLMNKYHGKTGLELLGRCVLDSKEIMRRDLPCCASVAKCNLSECFMVIGYLCIPSIQEVI